jgi:hypothetical protein
MSINLSALMKQRYDTAANWTAQNPTLLAGEIGIESDTKKWKVGTGATAWTSLVYAIGGTYPIVNADIAAAAAIVDTKLATIATGGKVSGTAITSGNISTSGSFTSTSTVTGTNLIPTGSGVPTNGIYLPAANSVAVATNGTGRLFVDANGNVGVGFSSPSSYSTQFVNYGSSVDIAGSASFVNDSSTAGTAAQRQGFLTQGGGTAAGISVWQNSFIVEGQASGGLSLGSYNASGSIKFYTNISRTERLRITSAGLVGIGTSSPGAKLEVAGSDAAPNGVGDFALSYASSKRLVFGDTGSPTFCSWIQSTQTLGAAFWPLALNPSGGNVGIGTTNPGGVLEAGAVSGAVTSGDLLVTTGSTTAKVTIGRLSGTSSDNTSFRIRDRIDRDVLTVDTNNFIYSQGGSERSRIDSSGRLLVGTGSDSGGALFQVNGDRIRVGTAKTPASASDTGTAGEICWDASYIYVCTATNTWKRTAIATW